MRSPIIYPPRLLLPALLGALLVTASVSSMAAPGEDPLIIARPVEYLALPTAKQTPSGALDPEADIPTSLKAKIIRYEAKAWNSPTGADDVLTNADVKTTTAEQGLRKTCIQEVGSTSGASTAFNRYGPSNQPQMVVLRGDLINTCR